MVFSASLSTEPFPSQLTPLSELFSSTVTAITVGERLTGGGRPKIAQKGLTIVADRRAEAFLCATAYRPQSAFARTHRSGVHEAGRGRAESCVSAEASAAARSLSEVHAAHRAQLTAARAVKNSFCSFKIRDRYFRRLVQRLEASRAKIKIGRREKIGQHVNSACDRVSRTATPSRASAPRPNPWAQRLPTRLGFVQSPIALGIVANDT